MTPLAGIVSNRLCTIPLKHHSANHEKKHQDWFDPNDQILRDLMAKKGPSPPKSVADKKHQIRYPSLQRCMQNTTEIYTSSKG